NDVEITNRIGSRCAFQAFQISAEWSGCRLCTVFAQPMRQLGPNCLYHKNVLTYFATHRAIFPQKKSYPIDYYLFLNLQLL
ncbi:hypothetical protein, partial [Klebsiella pneumoniae]|uniref:hypothetical protein n=1 Tax=Klebsiella pneumoniae TaxID=573 RepID=UPI001C558205